MINYLNKIKFSNFTMNKAMNKATNRAINTALLSILMVGVMLCIGCTTVTEPISDDDNVQSQPVLYEIDHISDGKSTLNNDDNNHKDIENKDSDNNKNSGHCMVDSCHYEEYNPKCTTKSFTCTLEIKPTHFCSGFVSCDNSCDTFITPEYSDCLDCFLECNTDDCRISKECDRMFPEFKHEFPGIYNRFNVVESDDESDD